MADKLTRKGVVLAKTEVTYGTDVVPAVANIILCTVPQYSPTGDKQTRDYMRDTLSPLGFNVGAKKATITFDCELKGPNLPAAADTATYLDPLLQSCGLVGASGIYTGSDVGMLYKPTSVIANMKSCTIYYYSDGIKRALVGCRGNVSFEFPVNGDPIAKFTMTGFYVTPTDTSNPTGITYPTYSAPSVVSAGFSIGSYNPTGIEKITIDMGNVITERKDANSATGLSAVLITGRAPKLTVDIEVDTLANFNPYSIWEAGTLKVLDATIGAKGNRVGFDIPNARMDEPAVADRNGRAIYNLNFELTGTDDEITIKTG